MKKTVLTFGLIAGGILSAMMLLTLPFHETIGFDRGEIIGYATMVGAFLLIYFGVRSYRDSVAGGVVSFGRAFKVGALIALVASSCYVATWEGFYYTVGDSFAENYQAHILERERAKGATSAELEKRRSEMERFAALYRNPAINVAITFLEPLPIGLLFALVSAALLRRKRGGARGGGQQDAGNAQPHFSSAVGP
jgi:hypothetical protein